jgi:16S rRNA (cytosine967-C5)-methyltransferase
MPVSPARAAAFDILMRVAEHGAYASELLHSEKFGKLSTADHGLATQLTMGVLRWQSSLDDSLAAVSSQKLDRLDPEVLIALRIGLFQLRFLERVPARAAIFESVELAKRARKRSAASFVNALLRKVAIGPIAPGSYEDDDAVALAAATAHPVWLVQRWVTRYGWERSQAICRYDQKISATSIYLHPRDLSARDVEVELTRSGVTLEAGALMTGARRVAAGDVTKTAAFTGGRVAIQDEASQLVAMLVGTGKKILDCCAAPGGKARLIADRNPEAQLVAMDIHSHRTALLRRLVTRKNISVVAADARRLPFGARFDRILVDVPCSGTGTLAHNPEIKWRLKQEDIDDLASRQTSILKAALAQLEPGGRVVYSTCSLEPEENEAVVEQALTNRTQVRLVSCHEELERLRYAGELAWPDIDSLVSGKFLRTIPGVHPCDGFFAAILEKSRNGALS